MTDEYHRTSPNADHQGPNGFDPSPPRRRPRSDAITYPSKSLFTRPEIRRLVADTVQARIAELSQGDGFGIEFLTHQLDEVVNELRGVE